MTTPLVIFAFNRPDKLARILESINKQTKSPDEIIAFVDGPREGRADDRQFVQAVKSLLISYGAEVNCRASNYGCARSIMEGVNEVSKEYKSFIVLEDDVLPVSSWYSSMTTLLERYAGEPQVGAVGSFPSIGKNALPGYGYDVLFSPRFSCWGWGSWSNRWGLIYSEWRRYFDGQELAWNLSALPGHAGLDIGNMLMNHPRQLWDASVAASFLANGLLQAITSYYLVHNIGADRTCGQDLIDKMWSNNPIQNRIPTEFPPAVGLNEDVCAAVRAYVNMMG